MKSTDEGRRSSKLLEPTELKIRANEKLHAAFVFSPQEREGGIILNFKIYFMTDKNYIYLGYTFGYIHNRGIAGS